jgi:fucose 4-O-acetylase-like acetyltransferase
VRVVNRVPGFMLSRSSAIADRNPDGSLRIRFLLRRNLFTQVLCVLIIVAGLCFSILILATQTSTALGSSVAAFFFSLWSLRGVLSSQIYTFPTLLDYAIVLLCCFMLAGLIWRIATHPELTGKVPS